MRTCLAIVVSSLALVSAAQAEPLRNAAGYYLVADEGEAVPPPLGVVPRSPATQEPVDPPRSPGAKQPSTVELTPLPPDQQDGPLAQANPEAREPQTASPRPPRVITLPPDEPVFTITGNHLASIGVGAVGGMVLLNSLVGLPAAAFIGGLAGQWYYANNVAPDETTRVRQRATGQQWQGAVTRDATAAARGRYLIPVEDMVYAR